MECYLFKPGFGGGGGGGARLSIKTVLGSIISLTDSAERSLRGLRLFGKTTQNGTPTPDAPIPLESVGDGGSVGVTVCGKNLLDFKKFSTPTSAVKITYLDDGVTISNTSGSYMGVDCNDLITPGSTICYSAYVDAGYTGVPRIGLKSISEDGTVSNTLVASSYTISNGHISLTYTVTSGLKGVRPVLFANWADANVKGSVTYRKLQLEISSTATEYEPYKEAQTLTLSTPNGLPGIHVSEGGNYTDENGWQWICDEIDFARGVYVQRVEKHKITSESSIMKSSNQTNGRGHFYLNIAFPNAPFKENFFPVLCSKFAATTGNSWGELNTILFSKDNNKFYFAMNTLDKDTAKSMLIGTEIIYALAEENTIPLSEIDQDAQVQYAALHTNYPSTTLYNDADSYMEVKYMAKGG